MLKPFLTLCLAGYCALSPTVALAQTAPVAQRGGLSRATGPATPAQLTAEQIALAAATKDFPAMYKVGNYDEIIRRCSGLLGQPEIVTSAGLILGQTQPGPEDALEAQTDPNPLLLGWRGIAAYQIGWFGMAERDITTALDKGANVPGGQKILDDINKLKELVPPNTYEVREGDYVVFRVYYTQMDVLTKRIIQILGDAYRTNNKLLDSDLIETPVYIFNSYLQFYQFSVVRTGSPPPSYALATGGRGGLYIPLQQRSGDLAYDPQDTYLENVVTHELDHAMLARVMGSVEFPHWFVEGLADLAGSELVLDRKVANNRTMAEMLMAKTIIVPTVLEQTASFGAYTELGDAIRNAGARRGAPNSYAESFSMVRYLMNNIQPGQLTRFLLRVRAEQSFSQAFHEEFNSTVPQFYDAWYQNLPATLQ